MVSMTVGRPRSLRVRVTLIVYMTCFTIGILSHAHDFLTHGWRPYQWGSVLLEAFWTPLILLDAWVVVLLIAGWRRSGLLAGLTIMTLDVAANSYALFGMGHEVFARNLVMQAACLGFIAGSIAFLWPKSPTLGQVDVG